MELSAAWLVFVRMKKTTKKRKKDMQRPKKHRCYLLLLEGVMMQLLSWQLQTIYLNIDGAIVLGLSWWNNLHHATGLHEDHPVGANVVFGWQSTCFFFLTKYPFMIYIIPIIIIEGWQQSNILAQSPTIMPLKQWLSLRWLVCHFIKCVCIRFGKDMCFEA